jgi:hypothetical protein
MKIKNDAMYEFVILEVYVQCKVCMFLVFLKFVTLLRSTKIFKFLKSQIKQGNWSIKKNN